MYVLLCAAGYVAPGDKFKDQPTIELQVISDLVSLRCQPGATVASGHAQCVLLPFSVVLQFGCLF
jgi:hypothetical protein